MPKPLPKFLMADDGEADYIIHCQAPRFVLRLHPDDETRDGVDDVTWWDPPPDKVQATLLQAEALEWGAAKLDEFHKSEAPQN